MAATGPCQVAKSLILAIIQLFGLDISLNPIYSAMLTYFMLNFMLNVSHCIVNPGSVTTNKVSPTNNLHQNVLFLSNNQTKSVTISNISA